MPMMQPASADLATLVAVVNLKHMPNIVGDLAKSQGKPRGAMPTVDASVMRGLINAKRLFQRFNALDFRADEEERGKLKTLCDWLTQQSAFLTSNPNPPLFPNWRDDQLVWRPVGADVTPPTDYPEAKRRKDWKGVVQAVMLGKIG